MKKIKFNNIINNINRNISSSNVNNSKVVNPLNNILTMLPGTSIKINTDVTNPLDNQFSTPIGNNYNTTITTTTTTTTSLLQLLLLQLLLSIPTFISPK